MKSVRKDIAGLLSKIYFAKVKVVSSIYLRPKPYYEHHEVARLVDKKPI